ncbi:hypothetical protein [Kutzneria kofuensis]|uniref:Uncharacterized protein n=1 Tax=Kutzneria kofuensis TaxID=103725 RepID=A0A7W9KDP9_9PSEU|nr:hypothetical protein [Kutzneria kofuensis]MBB5890666.1 hypothetical protein [Kutzneria kofuensis]
MSNSDLFGNKVAETSSPAKKSKTVNNMETIKTVIDRAWSERPYVLVGPTGQPHRVSDDGTVKPCIYWEADAIHQLIQQKVLVVGGRRSYQTRHGVKSGQSVLVPKSTRDMLSRWKSLKPLSSNGNTTRRSA